MLSSTVSHTNQILEADENIRANKFNVTLAFLSQQAAWLYERQLSQVRAQLRNVNKPSSAGNSPTPGSSSASGTAGGHAMTRAGSGGRTCIILYDFAGLTQL